MKETFMKILEMFKWPLAVVAIGVVFIVCFRQCIAAFINRAIRLKYPGGEIQAGPQSQEPAEIKVGSAEKLLQALDSPILLDAEKAIRDILTREGITTPEDKEKVLIRHLAAAHLNFVFTRIDFQIYLSQLKILEFLNSNPTAPKQMAKDVYNEAVTVYPEVLKNYPFEKYLGFLTTNNLILEREETLSITLVGREFLTFLVRTARNAVYRAG
jgi:hypothetical protein